MKKALALVLTLIMVLGMCTFAFAEEKVTLKVAFPGNIQAFIEGEDENHNFIIDYIEEQTGYDVEWVLLPTEDAKSKLNLMVAAQEVDVVVYGDYQTMLDYYNAGMLAVLNDYLDDAGFAEDTLELTKETTFGDDTFAVCYPGGQSEVTVVWTYNVQMLADAGIEVPEELTIDQWTDILYAIKEAYPDKIPMAAAGQTGTSSFMLKGMDNVYAAYGLPHEVRVGADGTLEYSAMTDDMRDCVEFIAKLYADGIIDPEYFVSTKDTIVPKIINGDVVSVNCEWYEYTGTYSPYMIDEAGELVAWKQVPVITGDRITNGQTNGAKTRQLAAITAQCEHIEEAMKLLAFMSTDDYYYRIMYGVPDVDSVRNEDGSFTFLDTPVGKAYSNNGTFFHNFYSVKESKALRCARLRPTYPSEERFNCDIMNFYAPKMVNNPIIVHAYVPDFDDNTSDFKDCVAVYIAKIANGEYGIEEFDSMVEELKDLGIEDAMAGLNEWYSEA